MKKYSLHALTITAFICLGLFAGCNNQQKKEPQKKLQKARTKTTDIATPQQAALTLPVLDALFYEPGFASSLKSTIGLTPAQIGRLKAAAHTSLRDLNEDGTADTSSARTATRAYEAQIEKIIGKDKAQQLLQLVNDSYSKGVEGLAPTKPNAVPGDTRIVVNAPAFRMDVFEGGKLIKTYRVGIGYPEFPLPTGMRRADTIIFNPAWTPPDEPWVKGKFHVGRRVLASNELNPLGRVKIPIGMPSLIHGGKPLSKIGDFASHGCVGLTNSQVLDFATTLARLGGAALSATDLQGFEQHKNDTRSIKLLTRVPIDLRYETIVAGDSCLHIYRDVYERGTNTIESAKRILANAGVGYDKLSEQEKTGLDSALLEMNKDARGNAIATDSLTAARDQVPDAKIARAKKGKVTSRVKGDKQVDVPITALRGKGYPEPVNLDTGVLPGEKNQKQPHVVKHHSKSHARSRGRK
ncbi:L,D-transpeptidase [Mucilaginibacter flavidus]|uniref:L,D-transpeptidase n=1 Tax=Mucilaginibacter flavidus TaxID=2949309 RepID=UPI002092D1D7|nr:L,D-transpeptidase [Mucilaginibacter flavidus]MCO5948111.1 L,D-transpeptidase [Mucilaginibacter flavidus]